MRFARRTRDYLRVQTDVLGNLSYLNIEQLRRLKATHRSAYDNNRSCFDAEVENATSGHNERNAIQTIKFSKTRALLITYEVIVNIF